jgi:putative transposase
MPRQPRPIIADVPIHITQRGNNRHKCFFSDADFLVYLDLLRNAAHHAHCQIHAYVLMTNHIHLLVSTKSTHGPASLMKSLGERYVQYVNRRYARSGTLWEGRYRSCLVQCERYLMVCQRYIELNPVRAQMVTHPVNYPWSSYRRNAHGEGAALVTPHPLYVSLGEDAASRESAYRALFSDALAVRTINRVRRATNGNLALGNKKFTDEMSTILGRPVTPQAGGRPKKQDSKAAKRRSDPGFAKTEV